jgi:gamma-glutamyl-gamma-aminobutyrate hydrolase PuuD
LKEADVVIFGGGADIDPSTYKEEPGSKTYSSPEREKKEKKDFELAIKLGKKLVGICRGHQLLTGDILQ